MNKEEEEMLIEAIEKHGYRIRVRVIGGNYFFDEPMAKDHYGTLIYEGEDIWTSSRIQVGTNGPYSIEHIVSFDSGMCIRGGVELFASKEAVDRWVGENRPALTEASAKYSNGVITPSMIDELFETEIRPILGEQTKEHNKVSIVKAIEVLINDLK